MNPGTGVRPLAVAPGGRGGYLGAGRPLHVAVVDPVPGEWRTMPGSSDQVGRRTLRRALDRALAFLADE